MEFGPPKVQAGPVGAVATAGPNATTRYTPVRLDKFVVLSLVTFGVYDVVWFYRNWRYVKANEGSRIWPWARALFAPLTYYGLLRRLAISGSVGLAAAYLLISAAWRLPDPYWLFSTLSFLALVPAVTAINNLNGDARGSSPSYAWRKRSVAVACLGVPLIGLAALGTFGPPTAVVGAAEMRPRDLAYLRAAGILAGDEELVYFYSGGFLSVRGEGVLATNWGVTSYWTDPVSEELSLAYLDYRDIRSVEANPGGGPFGSTYVRITGSDGSWFVFVLSTEGGGDLVFLEEIERRRASTPPVQSTA